MTVRIGYLNYAKTGTMSANSFVTGLGPGNLQSDQCSPSSGWQTEAGVVTLAGGALLRCDASIAQSTWRMFGLFNTNLTAGASITVTLWNNPDDPVAVWDTTVPGPQTGYGQIVVVAPQDYDADFVQFTFDDPDNPDGNISVGGAFFGIGWTPQVGITWDTTYGSTIRQTNTQSRGGQEYRTLLSRQRYWNVAFDSVTDAEAWDSLAELDRTAALGGNVLFIPDDTSADLYKEAVFGTLVPSADVGFGSRTLNARSWKAKITERL